LNAISDDFEDDQQSDEEDHDLGPSFPTVPLPQQVAIPDGIVIEPYPSPLAGAPLAGSKSCGDSDYSDYGKRHGRDNVYAPFCSKLDWDFARWVKLRGPSSNAVQEFLAIDGV
jgi:hypothetical protein